MVLLLLLYWVLAVTAAWNKSPTFDEPVHLAGGLSYWRHGDFRVNPENGSFPQRWFALPHALGEVSFPSTQRQAWRRSEQWVLAHQLFYGVGNDPLRLLRLGRGMAALLGVALLLLIYLWARKIHGPHGGLLALGLAALSPTLLAYGALMTSDLALALLLLGAASCLWIALHRLTLLTLLGSGAVLGLLLLTKASAPVIVPVALVLAAIRALDPRPMVVGRRTMGRSGRRVALIAGVLVAHALLAYLVVWTGYGLRYRATDGAGLFKSWEELLEGRPTLAAAVNTARERRLLPEAYLYQIPFVTRYSQRRAFLRGELRDSGWWTFFPLTVLLKAPLPLLILLLLAGAAAIASRRRRDAPREAESARGPPSALLATAPLTVTLLVYWLFALASPLNTGLRHILPTWPVLLILAGGAVRWFRWRSRALSIGVALAVAWLVAGSCWIRPHYLAFFNLAAGGPAGGYRHLVDSSLDWGQDLDGLRERLEQRGHNNLGTRPRVYLAYFGSADPAHHGLRVRRLPSFLNWPPPGGNRVRRLFGGVYCISATMLQNVHLVLQGPQGPLPPPRPWRAQHERLYRELRARFARAFAAKDRGALEEARRLIEQLGPARYELYARLRFARLCAALRRRAPDGTVGYSILIYRLSDQEVRRALDA